MRSVVEKELWACAYHMIERHGIDATVHAAMRADQLFVDGDYDGAATWRMIVLRINELLRERSGAVH